MKNKNPAFDAYIAKAQPFARPILTKIRALFHKACPEIEEVMKWSHPSFAYKGIVGGMAAFKEHIRFGFWKDSLMKNPARIFKNAKRHEEFGLRSLDDLATDDVLVAAIREAVQLNEAGVKTERPKDKAPKPALEPPDYFLAALRKKKGALAAFEKFSPSARREYVEWLVDAKQDATRAKRLATAVDWIAEGKHRNWKYMSGCVTR
ncbi:hypothetical protein AYO41_04555 [Verrucomicrobia bacterium SCGC AG-212-E04]|nr:hypothetical protein AYO41_04555 [Verrucomicrobia bacterium SCGC AG-212-E04]